MKRLAIIFSILAVACTVAISGPIDDSPTLRITNISTNSYSSDTISGQMEGWLESITIWPDTVSGATFTGSVAIALIRTNGFAGLTSTTMLYSNDTLQTVIVIQPRRNVHAVTSGTATNVGTILARYPITRGDRLVLYAQNTVEATNKNITAFTIIEK